MLDVPRTGSRSSSPRPWTASRLTSRALVSNCVVLVEDDVPVGAPSLLGLYEGTPLTERGEWYSGVLPDRITIYRKPILRMCRDDQDVVDEVRITVIHEIAHHFGIDDDRLHELGWG